MHIEQRLASFLAPAPVRTSIAWSINQNLTSCGLTGPGAAILCKGSHSLDMTG